MFHCPHTALMSAHRSSQRGLRRCLTEVWRRTPAWMPKRSSSALRMSQRHLYTRTLLLRQNSDEGKPPGEPNASPESTSETESSVLKTMDMETKARKMEGKYAMAEKLAEAQERVLPLPPRLAAMGAVGQCCSPASVNGAPLSASTQGDSIESLLVQSTIESIRSSAALHSTPKGESHRGIQRLLDYNKQWAVEVSRCNPTYFADLATEQKPEYLWIGCSDSRVPANEIVGLHPGDVFVHRNIGNIFSLSDLNCLSALQFAVDCLKVEHVIVAGHYKCGGVTAAMQGLKLGLTEHWIMQVTDIKNRWWHRVVDEIPETEHLNVLCELNVLEQLSHVVSCRIIQRRWCELNAIDAGPDMEDKAHIRVRREYTTSHPIYQMAHPASTARVFSNAARPVDVEVHGWVYSLDDGMLRPILRLTRFCNIEKEINKAREAVFIRYSGQ